MNDTAPMLGHNLPPSDAELLIEALAASSHPARQRAEQLAASAGRCVVNDAESAGKATLLVGLIVTAKETLEAQQHAAKAPYAALATAAFGYFKPALAALVDAKAAVLAMIADYAHERAALAAASGMVAPPIASAYGQRVVERRTWAYTIAKLDDVPRSFLMINEAAVKAHIKARPQDAAPVDVTGLHFFETTSVSVKR